MAKEHEDSRRLAESDHGKFYHSGSFNGQLPMLRKKISLWGLDVHRGMDPYNPPLFRTLRWPRLADSALQTSDALLEVIQRPLS